MNSIRNILFFWAIISLISCSPDLPKDVKQAMEAVPAKLDYNLHVKPILSDKCFACHGPDMAKQKAGLRLDEAKAAFASLPENPDKVAIDPGNLESSEVFHRILSSDPDYMMPTPESHLSLTAYEKAVLVKWINKGAEYKEHWAFVKPEMTDLPNVDNEKWTKNPIDYFILEKLEDKNLMPAPAADKETLLRRVSFDLTGLPPSLAEIDAFKNDNSPKAFEKVVDRLIASPHYGERMATDWLDLARFADSHGYTVDRLRDMSPYRDWVIKAFNTNQPYDKFVQWQLAGDLMPKPTQEMIIATAFNRNHQQNMEGGIIEEEFQTEYVIDRTNTFGDAFMGLSVGCAKCHDHKYDPISQKNYYQLYSFFNNVKEAGQISWDDALPTPTLMLPTKEQQKVAAFINNKLINELSNLSLAKTLGNADFEKWISSNTYIQLAMQEIPKVGLQAKFSFDKSGLKNEINPKQVSYTVLDGRLREPENIVAGKIGKGIKLNGDAWLELDQVGIFGKNDPFTIGVWIHLPKDFKEGVIFHKSLAERLYNFKGFNVYLRKNGKLEATMAHTAPSNAITKVSKALIPKGNWIHLALRYDGSSKAKGFEVFINGENLAMETEIDQLTKDILFTPRVTNTQPPLQFGGWYRGNGFKDGLIDDILVYNRQLTAYEMKIIAGKTNWKSITSKTPNQLSIIDKETLSQFYFGALHEPSLAAFEQIRQTRKVLSDSTEAIKEIMVMQEMPKPKQTYILERGVYDAFGAKVFPATPEKIFPFPKNLPKNRYGLAQWLTHVNNPLTARVVVNRIWQNVFGIGLVKSSEDFGNQGELPSHLELLDYLAVDFQKNGWNIKKLVKSLVMTATYQQDSKPSKEKVLADPENRFLSRGPANRLTAEMIRDNALAASGLLKTNIGGKSVKPYQPTGLWEINNARYTPDSSDEVYRRSLYVVVKRSVPHPTLVTFDATSRSFCTIRRQKTNTPLQALVTLNDPTFLEAAKVLAEQMTRNSDSQKAILTTYKKLTGKTPSQKEMQLLTSMKQKELEKFKANLNKTVGWLNAGYYQLDKSLDPAELAANAVVTILIINSDASLTKR